MVLFIWIWRVEGWFCGVLEDLDDASTYIAIVDELVVFCWRSDNQIKFYLGKVHNAYSKKEEYTMALAAYSNKDFFKLFFKVISPKKEKKLDRLIAHRDAIVGNSDDFVSMDWSNDKSIPLNRDIKYTILVKFILTQKNSYVNNKKY